MKRLLSTRPRTISFNVGSFTLTELLVVMAIVVVLVVLVLMVVSSIQESSRRTQCLSHLRQIGIAFHVYGLDHEGHFPFPNNSAYGESGQHRDLCWFNALDKLLSSAISIAVTKPEERALFIKQDPVFRTLEPSWKTNAHTLKMNENLGRYDPDGFETRSHFWSLNDCAEPARTVLLFDGRAEGETLSDGSPSIIAQRSDGTEGYVARRHRDGANVLFVDGHIEHRREHAQSSGTGKGWEAGGTTLVWKPWNP